jgi:hypothetical protein
MNHDLFFMSSTLSDHLTPQPSPTINNENCSQKGTFSCVALTKNDPQIFCGTRLSPALIYWV